MRLHAVAVRLVALVLVVCLELLPACPTALAATDNWSRVVGLEKNTKVWVYLRDGGLHTGWLVAADAEAITVRLMGEDQQIRREDVQRITRVYSAPSWPLVTGAVTAGAAATAGILYACSRNSSSCADPGGGFWVVLAIPGALGYLAYKHSLTDRVKVVYEAGPAKHPVDLPTDWQTIRRALPPSLQGVR